MAGNPPGYHGRLPRSGKLKKVNRNLGPIITEHSTMNSSVKGSIYHTAPRKPIIVNLKNTFIYMKYILTETFINRRYSKYRKMYIK